MDCKKKPHVIDCDTLSFYAVANGTKTHEVRQFDRMYELGDRLELHEIGLEDGMRTGQVIAPALAGSLHPVLWGCRTTSSHSRSLTWNSCSWV